MGHIYWVIMKGNECKKGQYIYGPFLQSEATFEYNRRRDMYPDDEDFIIRIVEEITLAEKPI